MQKTKTFDRVVSNTRQAIRAGAFYLAALELAKAKDAARELRNKRPRVTVRNGKWATV